MLFTCFVVSIDYYATGLMPKIAFLSTQQLNILVEYVFTKLTVSKLSLA